MRQLNITVFPTPLRPKHDGGALLLKYYVVVAARQTTAWHEYL